MAKFFNAIIGFIAIFCLKTINGNVCLKEDRCLCQINEYSKIDLSKISNLDDGDTTGNKFYFFGCKDENKSIIVNGTAKNATGSVITLFYTQKSQDFF